MNTKSTLLAFFIFTICFFEYSYGQVLECNAVEFQNFQYDWYHKPYDDSLADTTCSWSVSATHFYYMYHKQIEYDGYLYIAYPTFIFFPEVEGVLIEKIDLSTGDVIWKNTFDIRNNDRQELLAFLDINTDGNLDVYSYRRIKANGVAFGPFGFTNGEVDPCILAKRTFHNHTGELTDVHYPDQNASGITIVFRPSSGKLGDIAPLNDSIFLTCRINPPQMVVEHVNIMTGKSEHRFTDSVLVDKPYDITKRAILFNQKLKLVSPDTTVLLKFVITPNTFDTLDHQATLVVYNRKLEKVKNLNIEPYVGGFREMYLYNADSKYIYLSIDKKKNVTDRRFTEFLIFDYDGNLVQNVVIKEDNTHIAFVQIVPLPEYGRFLIAGKLGANNSIAFFLLKENGQLVAQKEMNITSQESIIPAGLHTLSSGDILLNGSVGTFTGLTFYSSCHHNLIKFRPEILDISTNKEISANLFTKAYPNPSSGMLTLDIHGIIGKADIRIFDMSGRNVYVHQGVTEGESTLDLSALSSGTYIYRIYQGSRQINSGQWVKVE